MPEVHKTVVSSQKGTCLFYSSLLDMISLPRPSLCHRALGDFVLEDSLSEVGSHPTFKASPDIKNTFQNHSGLRSAHNDGVASASAPSSPFQRVPFVPVHTSKQDRDHDTTFPWANYQGPQAIASLANVTVCSYFSNLKTQKPSLKRGRKVGLPHRHNGASASVDFLKQHLDYTLG